MSTTDLVLTKQDKHALILYQDPFSLVDENITFTTREEVAKNLPDICSRALA